MIYREASLKDAEQVDHLLTKLVIDEKENYDDSLEVMPVKDFYKNYVGREGFMIYVCECDERIVGYVYGFINEERIGTIDALFVESDYRNKGIATELMRLAKKWVKAQGVQYAQVSVLTKNVVAKKLYTQYGFDSFKEILRVEL